MISESSIAYKSSLAYYEFVRPEIGTNSRYTVSLIALPVRKSAIFDEILAPYSILSDYNIDVYQRRETVRLSALRDGEKMGTYVVRAGNSLQSVVDKTERGDSVVITDGYEATNDTWPVTIDTEIRVESNPHTRIAVPTAGRASLILDLDGSNRPPGITLVNIYIDAQGANSAFRIQNARFCTLVGCVAENAAEHGYLVFNRDHSPNSNRFFSCDAHLNEGNGFFIDDQAHSTTFVGCRAVDNGGRGLWTQNNYASSWIGGGLERNGDQGLYVEGSEVFTVTNAYIEGNAETASDQVLIASAQTATLAETYINGYDVPETNGVRFAASNNCSLRNIEYRNLNGLVVNDASRNTELYRTSHFSLDGSPFLVADTGEKTRSNGVLEPTDLSRVTGQYEGERAINDGTTGPYGLAIWNGSAWVSMLNGTVI